MTSQVPKKPNWLLLIGLAIASICVLSALGVAGAIYYFRYIANPNPLPSVESSTPGTEMILMEIDRSIENGKTVVLYEMKTSGIDPQKGLTLNYYPVGSSEGSSPVEVDIDTTGQVMQLNSNSPFVASMYEFAKGQPFLFGLISSDKQIQVFAKEVPFPIVASGENSCQISVELTDLSGTAFMIQGEGFIPQEILNYTSNSEGEIHNNTIKLDENGKFRLFMFPAVIGKLSGMNKIRFVGQHCETTVEYEWGPPAIENKQ